MRRLRLPKVSLAKDPPLSREEVAAFALAVYGPGKKWYSELARDLTRIRGTAAAISTAAVHQWMNADNRAPPWWATALIYRLLSEKRSELVVRVARLQYYMEEMENNKLVPTTNPSLSKKSDQNMPSGE
jgi:hypothetical protein